MGAADVSATVKPAGGQEAWADVAAVDHGTAVVLEKLQPVGAGALARVRGPRAVAGDGGARPGGVGLLVGQKNFMGLGRETSVHGGAA